MNKIYEDKLKNKTIREKLEGLNPAEKAALKGEEIVAVFKNLKLQKGKRFKINQATKKWK